MKQAGTHTRRPRAGGQVLVVVLLAMTLLTGLIFYVYNVGDQVNTRLEMQNAADAAVISGGAWMARSMNVVAMNNVTQTRLMALAIVLDALPLAAEMTIAEETGKEELADSLKAWGTVGPAFTPYEKDNFYRKGLAELYRQMTKGSDDSGRKHYDDVQLNRLIRIDETFDTGDERSLEGVYDINEDTRWRGGDGRIWQAITALDQFSQAVADSADELSQANAVRFGKENDASAAFLTPILPKFPGNRTEFYDFKPIFTQRLRVINDRRGGRDEFAVLKSGLVEKLQASGDIPWDLRTITVRGGAIPDFAYAHRLGPFAKIYKWRDYHHNQEGRWWEPNYDVYKIGYTSYGPLENAIRTVWSQLGLAGSRSGSADTSRLAFHLRSIAKLKLAYMFGLSAPQKMQYADKWIPDYDDAKGFVQGRNGVETNETSSRFLMDNGKEGASPQGDWQDLSATKKYGDSSLETSAAGASYTWTARLPYQGEHRVYVWWPKPTDGATRNSAAQYTVNHAFGSATVTKNQNNQSGRWVELGVWEFPEGQAASVTVSHQGANKTLADAVHFVPISKEENPKDQNNRKKSLVMKTRYYRVHVASTVHWDDSTHWMRTYERARPTPTFTPKRWYSYQLLSPLPESRTNDLGNPRIQPLYRWVLEYQGWRDISGYEKLTDHVWIRKRPHSVLQHHALDLRPRYELEEDGSLKYKKDDDGNLILDKNGDPQPIPIPYIIYSVDWRVFGGIEIRDEHEVDDILAGASRSELPAPILIDTTDEEVSDVLYTQRDGREREGVRVRPFTYLAVVRKDNTAPVWPTRFSALNPARSMYTVAQVKLFNNRSHGLWTQHWRVQLTPVVDWEDWVDEVGAGVADAGDTEGMVSAEEVEDAHQYMSGLSEDMVELYMNH